jgi:hypothetical protein
MANDAKPVNDPSEIAKMKERHLSMGLRMQALAARALQELEAKAASGQPLNLGEKDAQTLFDAGVKLERDASRRRRPH